MGMHNGMGMGMVLRMVLGLRIGFFCSVLFCFICLVLFWFCFVCFVLFCFVLFCFVLFCFVLFCEEHFRRVGTGPLLVLRFWACNS